MEEVEVFHKQIDYEAYKDCKNKHNTANNCIECCSNPYFDGIEIDYTCLQKRKLYVVRYLPAYMSEVYSILSYIDNFDFFEHIRQKKEISVVSIGGGPGTDIVAFNKWLSNLIRDDDAIEKVNYLRLDIHDDWDNIAPQLIHNYQSEKLEFNFRKIKRNIAEYPTNLGNNFKNCDVVILSYLLSEINSQNIDKVASNISRMLSSYSLVVINDRPQKEVIKKIEIVSNKIGGNIFTIKPSYGDHCGETYPDNIYNIAEPKILKKSIRYSIVVKK
jgi:hypothetical protein